MLQSTAVVMSGRRLHFLGPTKHSDAGLYWTCECASKHIHSAYLCGWLDQSTYTWTALTGGSQSILSLKFAWIFYIKVEFTFKEAIAIMALMSPSIKLQTKMLYVFINEPPHEKPTICICENREADQRLCFRYTDSTLPLLFKSEISSI